jgi:hypothetical protein
MEETVERKRVEIRHALKQLGNRIEGGDDAELLVWVSSNLACSHRPLRYDRFFGGSLRNIDPQATPRVFEWAKRIREAGIKSIICLMYEKELDFYRQLDLGANDLLDFYRTQGFQVCWLPWEDPAHSKSGQAEIRRKRDEIREQALIAFDQLPMPVLIHCSAGEDRTAPVASYLAQHRP